MTVEMHACDGDAPSAETCIAESRLQAEDIRLLEENPEHFLKNGDIVFMMPSTWWHSWTRWTGHSSTVTQALLEAPVQQNTADVFCALPGPIDTTGLLHVPGEQFVRAGLVLGKDYVLVQSVVWEKLRHWYGTQGLPQSRHVQISPGKPPSVHLHPVSVSVICQAKDTEQKQTKRVDTDYHVKVGDFKRQCCEMFSVELDSTEIFDYYNGYLHSALEPNLHMSLKDAKIMPEQSILLAPKGERTVYEKSDVDHMDTAPIIHSSSSIWDSTPATPIVTRSNNNSNWNSNNNTRNTNYNDDSVVQDSYKTPGLAGLANLGNTCFMNSSLQCLSHAVPLMKAFLSGAYIADLNRTNALGLKGQLAEAFGALMDNLWKGGISSVTPRGFKNKIQRFASQFTGYAQHDSQEFLAFLLDGLHEDINRVRVKPYLEDKDAADRSDSELAAEAWSNHLARNDSQIVDHFQGLLKSTLVCPQCHNASVKFDPYLYMSLPLPESKVRTVTFVLVPVLCSALAAEAVAELAAAVADGAITEVKEDAGDEGDLAGLAILADLASADSAAAREQVPRVSGGGMEMDVAACGNDGSSGSGRPRQFSVELPAAASLKDFLVVVAQIAGIQVPNVEELLLAAVVNRSIQEQVYLHQDNTESLADVVGERRFSENRLVVYQYPCARVGPLGGGQPVVLHQKRKKASSNTFNSKPYVSLPMNTGPHQKPYNRIQNQAIPATMQVLWLPPTHCYSLSGEITEVTEPGNQYNQKKEFIVSPTAPLFQLVLASLHPFANPSWVPPFPCAAAPPPHGLPNLGPNNPLSNNAMRTSNDLSNSPTEPPSAPVALSGLIPTVCETDGSTGTQPSDTVHTTTNPFCMMALPARTPKVTQTLPLTVAEKAHLEPETRLAGSGSSGGSGSGRPGNEIMSGSNTSWTIIPSAGGGSSVHGADIDDDGSGHAVSLHGDGSSLGGRSGSSIAEPGTPTMNDIQMSQPDGEDGVFGDENVMVENANDENMMVEAGEAEYELAEGILVNSPWSAFAPGEGKKQRHGGNRSPRVRLAAAAAIAGGGVEADVEMTRVSLEGLTSGSSVERALQQHQQQHRGAAGAAAQPGSHDPAPGSLEGGERMTMDGEQQQLPNGEVPASAADEAHLPQQLPVQYTNQMDSATALLLTQAAAVIVVQQVIAQQAIARQVQIDLQQIEERHSTDGGCGSGQQMQGAEPAEAGEGTVEVSAYGPPALAPFDMWQPQAPPSTSPRSQAAGGSCDGNTSNGQAHPEPQVAPFKLCLARDRGETSWSSYDMKSQDMTSCRHITIEWADQLQSSSCPYDAAAIDTPEEDPSAAAARERLAAGPRNVSLSACVSAFLQPEQLGKDDTWFCGKCKQHVQADKKLDIWSLPQVLIIHLKRFSYSRTSRDKLDTRVEYPLEGLDLSSVVMTDQVVPPTYDLFAVSNHFGSLGGGHYTAYACLPEDRSWYCYDDSHVSPAEPDTVANNSAAYVLFYRRRAEASADPADLLTLLQTARQEAEAVAAEAAAAADAAAEAEAAASAALLLQQQQQPGSGACSSGEGDNNDARAEDAGDGNRSSRAETPLPFSQERRGGSGSTSPMGHAGRSSEEGGDDDADMGRCDSRSPEVFQDSYQEGFPEGEEEMGRVSPCGSPLGVVGRAVGFTGSSGSRPAASIQDVLQQRSDSNHNSKSFGNNGCEGGSQPASGQQDGEWPSRWTSVAADAESGERDGGSEKECSPLMPWASGGAASGGQDAGISRQLTPMVFQQAGQELWADQRQPVVHANPDEVDMFSAQEDEQPEVQAPEAEQSEQRRMTLDP